MGAVSGLLSLANGYGTNEWVSEFQDTILVRNSRGMNAGATLFGLMSKLKNENAETVEFNWFERDPVTRQVIVTANAALNAVAISVSDAQTGGGDIHGVVQEGTILRTPTGELMRVTSLATFASNATVLTVERKHGTTANSNPSTNANARAMDATALVAGQVLSVVTLGKSEGAGPVDAVYEAPSTYTNYIQTFNSAVAITNAFKGSKLRTDIEGPLRERRIQALERVARDIELAYFFGRKYSVNNSSGRLLYTGGIVDSVEQIASAPAQILNGLAGTGVTLAVFNDWLASILTNGSDTKLAFCGPSAYAAISSFANSATNGFRITGQETVFGMNITEIVTPFGSLSLAMHPLFREITAYNKHMVIVDLGLIVQKVMEPLFLEPNIQENGADTYEEQFRAKYGIKLKFAGAFGYAYDFQKITA